LFLSFFFFISLSTSFIYTLSLHDALPIFFIPIALDFGILLWGMIFSLYFSLLWTLIFSLLSLWALVFLLHLAWDMMFLFLLLWADRKSTRLNSSHLGISYAVFCLKKKIIN